MISLDAFFKYVRPDVPGCPDEIMRDAVLRAAIEFCDYSELLAEDITISTTGGGSVYTLTAPADLRPLRVKSVRVDDTQLVKTDRDTARANGIDARSGRPMYFYTDGDTKVTVLPVPDAVYDLRLNMVTRPTRTATTVDDRLYEVWLMAIVHQALYHLLKMPRAVWFEATLAGLNRTMASREFDRARWENTSGHVNRPVMVQMRSARGGF